jgi:hypothetical protein
MIGARLWCAPLRVHRTPCGDGFPCNSTVPIQFSNSALRRCERKRSSNSLDCRVTEPVIGPADRPDPLAPRDDISMSVRVLAACFARAMSARFNPREYGGRREDRVAACTRGSRAKWICASAKTTGTGGSLRPSPRSGFTAYFGLSSVNQCLFATVASCVPLEQAQDLAPASGRQDHTTSPSAIAAARQSAGSRPPHSAPRS